MYDSPLQYCASCKQYIELDQTAEECAVRHGCKIDLCPFAHLFKPAMSDEDKASPRPQAPTQG